MLYGGKKINKKNLTRQNISYGDSVEMYHNKKDM